MNQLRCISIFLMHPAGAERKPLVPSETELQPQINALMLSLNEFLAPFVHPGQVENQEQNTLLCTVILDIVKFGYVLLSQPSEWQFSFGEDSSQLNDECLITCPGLEKLGGRDHIRYKYRLEILPPVIVPFRELGLQPNEVVHDV